MTDCLQRECTLTYLHVEAISMQLLRMGGVGDGNRTCLETANEGHAAHR